MKRSEMIQALSAVRKSRRRSPPNLERSAVHDRKASDLVRGAMVHPVEVDDPLEQGGKIAVMRSYRDDPLEKLFKLKQIDGQQLEAGREWQKDYEAAQGPSAVRAMQYKDPVDGGGQIPEPITDRQQEAIKRLAACDRELGQLGSQIIRLYLGYRFAASGISSHMGDTSKSGVDYFGRRIRECLETLTVFYGFRANFEGWDRQREKKLRHTENIEKIRERGA